MGIFDMFSSDEGKIKNALDEWVSKFEAEGLVVSTAAKELMRESLDSQLHPEKYPENFMMDSVIRIESKVRNDNGQTTPLDGVNSLGDALEKVSKEVKEETQYSYREDYYKNASNQPDKIASPNELYSLEEEMDDIVKEIFSVVGGEDKVKHLVAWGEKKLPKKTMQQYEEPYKALISKLGHANILPGEKLRGNAISENDIQKIKDALRYIESLYIQTPPSLR